MMDTRVVLSTLVVSMPNVISFESAMEQVADQEPSLLLGNGFSIGHFSYSNLLENAGLAEDGPERALFRILDTVDFERVILALEDGAIVAQAYENAASATLWAADADKVRNALVTAIRATHPAHREDISDQIPACAAVLKRFSSIFTLNYDLLLYWVILEDTKSFKDGFGLGKESNGFRGPFNEGAYCNVFNLHGGLHLFKTASGTIQKRLMGSSGVIDAIAQTITEDRRVPILVTEGKSTSKMARINSVPYLKHCYDKLRALSGSCFVYGHSAKENDGHIYRAVFSSQIDRLYFCIHRPTSNINEIDGELARYQKQSRSRIEYVFVDAETVPMWPATP